MGLHQADNFLYTGVVHQGLMFGLDVDPQPPVDFFYDGEGPWRFGRYGAWVHHTPGHCPGGVCLAVGRDGEAQRTLFVGDTLFLGSIGRTDLPGGDLPTLLQSIRGVLFTFPDDDSRALRPWRSNDDWSRAEDESISDLKCARPAAICQRTGAGFEDRAVVTATS